MFRKHGMLIQNALRTPQLHGIPWIEPRIYYDDSHTMTQPVFKKHNNFQQLKWALSTFIEWPLSWNEPYQHLSNGLFLNSQNEPYQHLSNDLFLNSWNEPYQHLPNDLFLTTFYVTLRDWVILNKITWKIYS